MPPLPRFQTLLVIVSPLTPSKAQFRLASQRLRQLQDKKDAQGFVVRKDIATLLRQGNAWLARSKAQGLLVEEAFADLLERVERHIGVLLEHLNELDLKSVSGGYNDLTTY